MCVLRSPALFFNATTALLKRRLATSTGWIVLRRVLDSERSGGIYEIEVI